MRSLSGQDVFLPLFLAALCTASDLPSSDEVVVKPEVYSLHITSNIRYRYAQTLVTSRVANRANESQETTFHVVLPDTAFITGFVMIINDKEYRAYVDEKDEAKREYDKAVAAGQSAAHVAYSARDSNQFTVSINIEPMTKVTFNMTYEELLERVRSKYKHEININPGQVVKDMRIEIDIEDISPIVNLKVPELKMTNEIKEVEKDNSLVEIHHKIPEVAKIVWAPSEEQQKELRSEGIEGQLIVYYDVDRTNNSQQILVDEGYFVHFFANDDLPRLNKYVVFVLDLSGSMHGRKLHQLKEAMDKILSDLKENNYFSLVVFSETAKAWSPNKTITFSFHDFRKPAVDEELSTDYIVPATPENINSAKKFVQSLDDLGGTNIIAGLRMGINLTNLGNKLLGNMKDKPEPIIIFLTDGEPNVEMSDTKKITKVATEMNTLRSGIFSLGFGDGADFKFLRNLSLANSAYAKNIYEGADATLQLENFFDEIASPLLADVTFFYVPGQVEDDLTDVHFSTLFSGSELVVAGRLVNDSLSGNLVARSPSGQEEIPFARITVIDCIPAPPTPGNKTYGHLERLWAYKNIKQLLDKNLVAQNDSLKEEALKLALKYSFVTPLTSLVVVKPNETTTVDAEKSGSENNLHAYLPSRSASLAAGAPQPFVQKGLHYFGAAHPLINSQLMVLPPMSYGPPSPLAIESSDNLMAIPDKTVTMDLTDADWSGPGLELSNLTEVTWLSSPTPGSDRLTPPPTVSPTDVILLSPVNETEASNCSVNSTSGQCKHFVHCILKVFVDSVEKFEPYKCHIEPNYLGVCCPSNILNMN